MLRYIIRDGEKVLQQEKHIGVQTDGTPILEWQDIPVVEENEK